MANPTGKLQGFKSTMHYTAAGASSSVKLKSLSEWKLTVKADDIDASDHDSLGWKDKLTGMAEWSATIKAVYFEGDTTQQGILSALVAALTTTAAGILCTFEPIDAAGGFAYSGTGNITDYSHSAGNNDAQGIDITISGRGPLTFAAQAIAD